MMKYLKYDYNKPFTFDRVIRLIITIFGFGFAIYMIYILRNALLPFLIAWLIAYLLNPLVRIIQMKLKIRKRYLAVFLTFFLVLIILITMGFIITPMVMNEIVQINLLLSSYELQSLRVEGVPVSVYEFIEGNLDIQSLREMLSKEQAQETFKFLLPAVQGVLSSSISVILGLTVVFIVILYLIFILLDYDKIKLLWKNLVPPKHRPFIEKISIDVEVSMNRYFRHQALICLIVGLLFAIGFQVIGLPLAILMGALIAVLHMIPYLHTLSLVPAILLCWLKATQTGQSFWALIGLIVLLYIGIQCIIDLFLVPRIMGKAMGLNPAVILLSLSVWGSLMGIIGMIIAIPLTTLLLSYYQQFINNEFEFEDEGVEKEN